MSVAADATDPLATLGAGMEGLDDFDLGDDALLGLGLDEATVGHISTELVAGDTKLAV